MVDISTKPAFCLKGNEEGVNLGEMNKRWRVIGRTGGRGNCNQDVIFERRTNVLYTLY